MSRTLELRGPNGISRTQELTTGRHVIGRGQDADIVLDDEKTSRHHAAITITDDGTTTVEDLASTNGTTVNGQRITTPTQLQPGDRLTIGDTTLALPTDAPPTTLGTSTPTPTPTPSRIERLQLRRSIRRSTLLATIAGLGIAAALAVVLLFVTGVIGGDEEPPTVAEVVEEVRPSLVQIRRVTESGSEAIGSGWVYDAENGLIVTSAAIVNAETKLVGRLAEEKRDRPLTLVGVAPCEELAVLRAGARDGMESLPLGSQADLQRGEDVVSLGYPATQLSEAARLTATQGVVSVVKSPTTPADLPRFENVVLTDATINPGSVGGPLVDLDGRLAGVNTFFNRGGGIEGQNYAVGVDHVKDVVPRLAVGHSAGWTGMGFFYPADEEDLTELDLPSVAGIVVVSAVPGTPAADAGFGQAPVLLVAIDGQTLTNTLRSYCNLVGDYAQGETARFTVYAQGDEQPQDVDVTFE